MAENRGSDYNKLTIYAAAFCTVAAWGASFAGAKVALAQAPALFVMSARFFLSFAILIVVAACRGELRLPTRRQAQVLAFLGFMGFFFHIGIQTVAMKTSGSANANWQMAAAPAIAAVLAGIFLKEKLSSRGILGIVVAFAGVAVVLGLGTAGARGFSAYNVGDFLISVSTLNWAAFMVITRFVLKDKSYTPIFTIFWEMFFAVLLCIPTLALTHTDVSIAAGFALRTWCALGLLGFLCSGLAYVWWYYATARLPVAHVMAFQFFQPIVGAIVGYWVVGERFTPWLFIGGAMILSGVWTVNRSK